MGQNGDCLGVFTDVSAAVNGRIFEFHAEAKSENDKQKTYSHCMIHRVALITNKNSVPSKKY